MGAVGLPESAAGGVRGHHEKDDADFARGRRDQVSKLIDAQWAQWLYTRPEFPPGVTCMMETAPDGRSIQITVGSWENDRAIQIQGQDFEDDVAAMNHAQTQGWKVSCEYHGFIY